jgi:hypothetical protein
MRSFNNATLRIKALRQTVSEGTAFSVLLLTGETFVEIGAAKEIGDVITECVWSLPELQEGDRLVFRSASGKRSYRTILDEVELLDGYSEGTAIPDYAVNSMISADNSFTIELMSKAVWTYAVEAIDSAGSIIMATTNNVDLVNPPPKPVIDAVDISTVTGEIGERVWKEDFSAFTNVFKTGKNTAIWLNGVTIPHWQAYYGNEPITELIRNNGAGTQKGLYAYWSTNKLYETYSLGVMTSGTADRLIYGLSFLNDTEYSVQKINVAFDCMQFGFRNTSEQAVVCEYLVTNELVSVCAEGCWCVCDNLIYRTTKDNNSGLVNGIDLPVKTVISAELKNISVPVNSYFMLRWRRTAVSNAAAMSMDNIAVSFTIQSHPFRIVVR